MVDSVSTENLTDHIQWIEEPGWENSSVNFTAGIDKPGIPNAEIQAAWVGEIAELAKDLGTDMVRIFTGYERPDISYDKQYAEVVKGLKMAGKLAAEQGAGLDGRAQARHH